MSTHLHTEATHMEHLQDRCVLCRYKVVNSYK